MRQVRSASSKMWPAISADACKEYYRRFYGPDNAVIVAVGDTDASKIFDAAERNFGNKIARILQTPGKHLSAKHHDREGNRRMRRKVEFDVPVLVIGYPAPPSSHEDAVALEILQLVVAGGETSRLHREVVRRQSLAVMTGGMNHLLKTAGMSMFFAAFTPDIAAGRVERAFDREIKRILTEGITREEMEKVRNTTLTNRTFELYSADNISQRIGYSETIEGNYRLWVERLETLKNLDRDRLVEVARRWWDDDEKIRAFSGTPAIESFAFYWRHFAPHSRFRQTQQSEVHKEQFMKFNYTFPPLDEFTLDNGMKIICIADHEQSGLVIALQLPVGHFSDPPERAGLCELTAGLLAKGPRP